MVMQGRGEAGGPEWLHKGEGEACGPVFRGCMVDRESQSRVVM